MELRKLFIHLIDCLVYSKGVVISLRPNLQMLVLFSALLTLARSQDLGWEKSYRWVLVSTRRRRWRSLWPPIGSASSRLSRGLESGLRVSRRAAPPKRSQAAEELAPNQLSFLGAAPEGVAVLERAAQEELNRLVDATICADLIDVVAMSTQREGQVVRHSQKLPEVEP